MNTTTFTTDVQETEAMYWPWYGWSFLWFIPVTISLSAFAYYFHSIYLDYRWKKNKAICTGIVVDRRYTLDTGGEYTEHKYSITYKFEDRRKEITAKYMQQVFDKFLSYDSYRVPSDILHILTQYVGYDTFVFWYGPFENKTESISEERYYKFRKNDRIQVEYNVKNPRRSVVLSHPSHYDATFMNLCLDKVICPAIYGCWYSICVAIPVGIVFGLIATLNYMDGGHAEQIKMMLLLFSLAIAFVFVLWIWHSNKHQTFPFKIKLDRYLNCDKMHSYQIL